MGRYVVAHALREAGFTVHVMADVFGDDPAMRKDEDWVTEVTTRGWVILTKDDKMRMKPRERDVLLEHGARVFCITNAHMKAEDMAARLVKHRGKIVRLSRKPGPYVYAVYEEAVRRLFPPDAARK